MYREYRKSMSVNSCSKWEEIKVRRIARPRCVYCIVAESTISRRDAMQVQGSMDKNDVCIEISIDEGVIQSIGFKQQLRNEVRVKNSTGLYTPPKYLDPPNTKSGSDTIVGCCCKSRWMWAHL